MTKNRTWRAAALLLVLTLITSCFVGGTFAKYVTSADTTDTARVAKWGVVVDATSDAFNTTYAKEDTTVTDTSITDSVSAGVDVVAPGTEGNLLTSTITGTPEVAVKVKNVATLTLEGWTIDTNVEYFPIIITVDSVKYKMGATASDTNTEKVFTSITALKDAVKTALDKEANHAPLTSLENMYDHTVTWEWAFEGTDGYQTNEKDTKLGNLPDAPTIKIDYSTTVEQID